MDLLPKVLICEPLAAESLNWHGALPFSRELGGMTEMSAPVSIRKFLLDDLSVTNKRLILGPPSSVAVLEWPFSFLAFETYEICKVLRIS